jgi:DNA mismatch repair protein MutL
MPRIHSLSSSVIAAIAAGEVAERPSTIIKELIENAIDAEATEIAIYLENDRSNSQPKIIVSDNGIGMDESDLALSVQRHTTSKIQTAEDLLRVTTFGFRGEALASIGSVSTLTIQTKTAEQTAGQELRIEFGQLVHQKPAATVQGTTITIENLFAETPARLKFLKKPQTELRLILDVVTTAALSHPEIGFLLSNNKKVLMNLRQQQDLPTRVQALFGTENAVLFSPIESGQPFFQLQGLIGTPQLARQTKTHQFLFVNKRPVEHQPLAQIIKDAYGSLLAPRSHPAFILHLELPPTGVDINVHPRKETVKFLEEAHILDFVRQAIQQTLQQMNTTYRAASSDQKWKVQEPSPTYSPFSRQASPITHKDLRQTQEPWKFTTSTEQTPIFQLHNTYLILQTAEGMTIIDQHAAHERILYEQYAQALEKKSQEMTLERHELSKPVRIQLTAADYHTLRDHFSTLRQIGFELEDFGETSIRITHVPQTLRDRNLTQLLREFTDDLLQGKPIKMADTLAHRTLAYLACRNAIQAGDPLTIEQRQELIEKLQHTQNHATCPHGRPTTVTWEIADLEKLFRRR